MKNLFKAMLVILIAVSFSEAKAQKSVGAGVAYATNIDNIGFNLNGNYVIDEKWSAAPSFTYFLKKDYVTWMVLDLDANYQFSEIENMGSLYAIGGLNMTFFDINYEFDYGEYYDGGFRGSDFGVNLGIGLLVPAGEKLAIAPEIRYTLGGANFARVGVKVMLTI